MIVLPWAGKLDREFRTTVRRIPDRKGTPRAEPKAKLPQSVADVLQNHVVLEVECIDRMYLIAIVPRLQITKGRGAARLPCPLLTPPRRAAFSVTGARSTGCISRGQWSRSRPVFAMRRLRPITTRFGLN